MQLYAAWWHTSLHGVYDLTAVPVRKWI